MGLKSITAKRRAANAVQIFKTILLAALVVSLILLVVVYISGMRVYEIMAGNDDLGNSFDKLWSVQSGSEPMGLDGSRLQPEFIGYRQSTYQTPLGCVGDAESIGELYELVKPCILELFGSDAVCRELPSDFGAELFDKARQSREFVYLRYHQPVLYQLIYAYAADTLTVSESDVAVGAAGNIGAYVSELIIVPDMDFAAHRFIAYAHDSEGRYYEFRPGEHIMASNFYISKLAEGADIVGTYEFDFAEGSRFSSPIPMIDGELECSSLTVETVTLEDETIFNSLLRLLGYNPDKLDGYTDDGDDVYIDSHSQLRVGNDRLAFLTSDASDAYGGTMRGLRIDTLLGYTVEGVPSLFDKLTAVDNLVRRLYEVSPTLAGGEAALCLGDVYSDNSLITVEYIPVLDGIRIGSEPYLRATLTDDTICELELCLLTISAGDEVSLIPPPDYVLGKLESLELLPTGRLIGAVRLNYTDDAAEWTVELEG